jgi:BMFP domain-containing protein YqiC
MQTDNRFFDDLSKLATSAAGTFAGMGREVETMMRERFERFLGGLDLVKRDEFDAVKEMAAQVRTENEALKARLEALEARVLQNTPLSTEN